MHLSIGYFYKDQLNLYGDNGNVEILVSRAAKRGIKTDVSDFGLGTDMTDRTLKDINLVFMGGGPDSEQKLVYKDILENKGAYLKDYINNGGVGLYICGSYQLLGNYYKASDGSVLEGIGAFDLYTEHFGLKKPRCIGNTVASINNRILSDEVFKANNNIGDTIVGFENHGGRTYLADRHSSLARVFKGHGNNSEDQTEGIYFNNSLGTYFHGPFLSKNPHIADFLIAKALSVDKLDMLDDALIFKAHTASIKLVQ